MAECLTETAVPTRSIITNGIEQILQQLQENRLGGGPVRMVRIDEIQGRLKIFQFRVAAFGRGGTTDRLKHCARFNPVLSKVLSYWQNPADGLIFLCDGHHRMQLAKRDGVEMVAWPAKTSPPSRSSA